MISFDTIRSFYPEYMRDNPQYFKYMLKEYLQLTMLDYLATTSYIRKINFIGGTCLRLLMGIDRFSEDLDFDCKNFSREDFMEMTEATGTFLSRAGWNVVVKDSTSDRLHAFRRNLYFPELMYRLGLSPHREERFLIKIECQDQGVIYPSRTDYIKGCGFFFPFPLPPAEVLCSMKLAAMFLRQKGRDFYDAMFLLSRTRPDYEFLSAKCGISNLQELKVQATDLFRKVDLKSKKRDFEHLLFNRSGSERILLMDAFFKTLQEA